MAISLTLKKKGDTAVTYSIQSLLGLQGLIVAEVVHHFDQCYLYVIPRRSTGTCSQCGKRTNRVHGYRSPQFVKHVSVGDTQLFLVIHKRRFYCPRCQVAFVEEIAGLSKWSRHTTKLADEILNRLKESSFATVTRTTSLTYRKQAQALLLKVNPSIPDWESVNKPFVMGLDEQSFAGHDMITTITDITHRRLLCVLPNDRKATIAQFYDSIPDDKTDLVQAICTDMRPVYDTAKSKHPKLKSVPRVIDKFHVIADANKRVNDERLIIEEMVLHHKQKLPRKLLMKGKERLKENEQKKLKTVLSLYPDLFMYYFTKESLRELYNQESKEEATRLLKSLISMLYRQKEKGCSDWAGTLERFYEGILNYYDFRVTNGYTEGVHTKMKLIKRQGFGYRNKDIYLRKLMLGFMPFGVLLSPHLLQ